MFQGINPFACVVLAVGRHCNTMVTAIRALVGEDEAEDLRIGALQRILPDWEGEKREVYLVWGRSARLTYRAQRFIDFIRKATVDIPVLHV